MQPKATQHYITLTLQGRWHEARVCVCSCVCVCVVCVNAYIYLGRDFYVSKAQKDSFVFISGVCLHQSHTHISTRACTVYAATEGHTEHTHSLILIQSWKNDSSAARR